MNRGVPPTARNARTGELTPPGITRCARSNSVWLASLIGHPSRCALRYSPWQRTGGSSASVDAPLRRPRLFLFRCVGRLAGLGALRSLALLRRRQCPEEAIGQHVAHAGAKARV